MRPDVPCAFLKFKKMRLNMPCALRKSDFLTDRFPVYFYSDEEGGSLRAVRTVRSAFPLLLVRECIAEVEFSYGMWWPSRGALASFACSFG